jgi:hypothetical protein
MTNVKNRYYEKNNIVWNGSPVKENLKINCQQKRIHLNDTPNPVLMKGQIRIIDCKGYLRRVLRCNYYRTGFEN